MTARERVSVGEALWAFGLAFGGLLVMSALLPPGLATMAVLQITCLAVPAVLAVRLARVPLAVGLGLRWPGARAMVGAGLVGAGMWYLNLWLVLPIVDRLSPVSLEDLAEQMQWTDRAAVWRALVVVLLAAVCEELLLRGVIARALLPRARIAGATLASAMLFGALHVGGPNLVPATVLGIALGFAATTSDSAIPALVIHLINNAVAALAGPALEGTAAWKWLEHNDFWVGLGALAAVGSGVILLWTARREASS